MKLHIKVMPSSSKDCITGWLENTLKVKVKAPPEKGKANKAIIQILEKSLDLAKGSIQIASGTTSCRKIIKIKCDNEGVIKNKLADILND